MSMLSVSDLFSKRLLLLVSLVVIGGGASLAKSFDIHGQIVIGLEHMVGGDWAMHLIVATTLGFFASWATPKSYYQYSSIPFSPWVGLLLVAVSIDEFSQMYLPLRQFSWTDLGINLSGVLMGSVVYMFYISCRYPSYLR
ncbi:VanZ family protein [Vibrio atypicus]|uniref:VanZ family protein n=1 Tax=Vibrio atypicus TaxID=558271 RepID=UPI001CED90D8|nr:VanZ family protein [Vibrio atypicus]